MMQFKNQTIALVANGEVDGGFEEFQTIVAVDGGLSHVDRCGKKPTLIIGDFDSASPEMLEKYKKVPQVHTPDQSHIDLEKALETILPFEPEKIVVFGASGKRSDHFLTNLLILSRYPEKIVFESREETLYVLNNQSLIKTRQGQTLSLIPLNGPVVGITSKGLKWELNDSTLDKHFVGISNVALQDVVEIAHKSGDLLLCLNKFV